MYFTAIEKAMVLESFANENYSMSKIIFTHRKHKENELKTLRDKKRINRFQYNRYMKELDTQFKICSDAMEQLFIVKNKYFTEYLRMFESTIYDLDMIGHH